MAPANPVAPIGTTATFPATVAESSPPPACGVPVMRIAVAATWSAMGRPCRNFMFFPSVQRIGAEPVAQTAALSPRDWYTSSG